MKKVKPVKLFTLDTETYNGLFGGLKRIAIYDGIKVIYGYTFEDIEKEMIKYYDLNYDVHVYIHNIEFDARKLPAIFEPDRIDWSGCVVINGKLTTIKCKKYTFHDSFKLLPMSLKKLSKDFGVEHAKLDLWQEVQKLYKNEYTDIVDFLDRCDVDNELYLKYLGYDVISLYEILEKIMSITGIKVEDFVKRISTASLSRFIFKNGFNGDKFIEKGSRRSDYEILCQYNYNYDMDIENFLRDSYCGGRTEVFKIELNSKAFHYDVNSLYPSVMINGNFPVGKPKYYDDENIAKYYFDKWLKDKKGIGFLSCEVYIPKQHIPPLPVKMEKLAFVCGHVYGVWNFEELEYAVKECGCKITKYKEVVFYNKTFPVFKRFITKMVEIKNEGTRTKNDALRTLGKLLMNVGYGYTGMRRDDKTALVPLEDLEKIKEKGIQIKNFNEKLGFMEIPQQIKSEYIQVGVASTVTCRARLVLLKALRYCSERGNVYYCDTDSIVTDVKLPDEIVDSVELGKWDLENTIEKGLFLKPKVYSEISINNETNIKFKGVSCETQNELNFKSYEELLEELQEQTKEFIIVEKNKATFRSLMYMKKQGLPDDYYETRDKKLNLNTTEKRKMNYKENYTEPYYFESINDFNNFSFSPKKKKINFSMA